MTFEFINNEGPNSVEAVFKRLSASAISLEAVSAFATRAGVDAILPYIRRIAERGRVFLAVGLYQGITEPSALRSLRKAAKAYPGRLVIAVAKNPSLHRKLYAFRLRQKTLLLVGSSNLTSDGLQSDGEFNVLVQLPGVGRSGQIFRRHVRELADKSATLPLTPQLISDYERARAKPKPGVERSALRRILKSKRRSPGPSPTPPLERTWSRTFIGGYTKKATEQVVYDQTSWDRRGWTWCTVDSGDRVSAGDHVLMFDYVNDPSWARVVLVKGVTRTALPTPDGRHFFAYSNARGFQKRKVGQALWSDLAENGWDLNKKKSQSTRTLSPNARAAVLKVFKK